MGLLIKLLNGDTTLKSLKYGKDQLGGADSNQPFIQTPIGEPEQSGFASSDSILRGGITAPIHAAIDVVRLTKYFTTPGGLGFVVKQNILSRAAVKTEVGGFLNEGVYTPLSTLAQAGVGFLGTHFEKQGLIPGISRKTYEEAAYKNNIEDKNNFEKKKFDNRLLDIWWNKQQSIYDGLIKDYGGGPGSILGVGKTKIHFAKDGDGNAVRTGINNLQYSKADTQYKFLHGGNPRITTQNQTTYKSQILPILEERGRQLLQDTYFSPNTGQYGVVAKPNPTTPLDTYSSKNTLITDSSQIGTQGDGTPNSGTPGTTDLEKAEKLNGVEIEGYLANLNKNAGPYDVTSNQTQLDTTPNPNRVGGRGISYDFRQTNRKKRGFTDAYDQPYDYTIPEVDSNINGNWKFFDKDTNTLDKIYYKTGATKRTSTDITSDKDIIPFRINILNPQKLTTKTLNFRAYIDNFSDNYDATWTKQSYMGRAEAFHKYTAFNRDISLGFTVAAESQLNLYNIHEQLNTLVSSLAPTYTAAGYMAGNIHKVTIGNYIEEQYGVISSINLEIMNESPWGIDAGRQLPYYIKVTAKFTPIHKSRPEYNVGQFINQ